MLSKRDQWLRHLMAQRDIESRQGGIEPRQVLESGLQLYVLSCLQQAHETLGNDTYRELRELALFAASNLADDQAEHPFAVLMCEQEDPGSLQQWLSGRKDPHCSGNEVPCPGPFGAVQRR
jgi:hypothetical protein